MSGVPVQRVDTPHGGEFVFDEGGKRLARMVYKSAGDGKIDIVHTEVDASLKGRGIGRNLLDAAVAWARQTGTKVIATCPYAKSQFEKDASIRDVLA